LTTGRSTHGHVVTATLFDYVIFCTDYFFFSITIPIRHPAKIGNQLGLGPQTLVFVWKMIDIIDSNHGNQPSAPGSELVIGWFNWDETKCVGIYSMWLRKYLHGNHPSAAENDLVIQWSNWRGTSSIRTNAAQMSRYL